MEILIKLSPDDITEAIKEYLVRRNFAYIDHEFVDGEAQVHAAPCAPTVDYAKYAQLAAVAMSPEAVLEIARAAQRGETPAPAAVEEPALTLTQLHTQSATDFDSHSSTTESPTRKVNMRRPATSPILGPTPIVTPGARATVVDEAAPLGIDELAAALKAQDKS